MVGTYSGYTIARIGNGAFYSTADDSGLIICNSLTLPEGLASIGDTAFQACTIPSVTLPNTLALIGDFAFACINLTQIHTPNEKTTGDTIGSWTWGDSDTYTTVAFYGSNGSIIGQFIEETGSYPLCPTSLAYGKLDFSQFSELAGLQLLFPTCYGITEVTFPSDLTSISDMAFAYDVNIPSITLPSGLKTIGQSAFIGCTSLTALTIPSSVTSIGEDAFAECTGIVSDMDLSNFTSVPTNWKAKCFDGMTVDFIIPVEYNPSDRSEWYDNIVSWTGLTNNIYFSDEASNWGEGIASGGTFDFIVTDSSGGIAIIGATNVVANDLKFLDSQGITAIDGSIFENNTNLTGALTLSNTITFVGIDTFSGCTGLTGITFGSGLTEIGNGAFSGCTGVSSANLSSLDSTTIPSWSNGVFSSFKSATEWTLPYTTTTTDLTKWYSAVKNWTSVDSPTTYMKGPATDWGQNVSGGECKVAINDDTCTKFTLLDASNMVAENLILNNSITDIGDNAFTDDTNLTGTLTLPSTINSIGTDAFSGCSKITAIDLSNYTSVPANWKNGCFNGLNAEFLIPANTDKLTLSSWYSAIKNWTGTTTPDVEMSADPQNYATGATKGTFELKLNDATGASFTLVDATDVVSTNLSINSNSGIVAIADGAFQNNRNLAGSIDIPASITTIGANVLDGCTYLNEICLNWTDLSSVNALNINQYWLGEEAATTLNRPETAILVPDGMADAYQKVAAEWGMNLCNITDGTSPSPSPSPTPTPSDSSSDLGLILGLSLGIGIPVLIGVILNAITLSKITKKK